MSNLNQIEKDLAKGDNEMEKDLIFPIADLPKLVRPTVGTKNRITAVYPYKDEKDNTLYEIIRQREGQPYLCRRPTEDEEYEYSIKGIRKVIYNLPRILQAIKNEEVIFITEGESKVDTLTELNIPATTVLGKQPNKWNSDYNSLIEGAKGIIILQDDDQNGINFANTTYSTLREILPEEKIGILPITSICPELEKQGADITDVKEFMKNDEKLSLILNSIASQI